MTSDLLYQLALSRVPNIGNIHAKTLVSHFPSVQSIFKARKRELESIEGIGTMRASAIRSFSDFTRCEEEIRFIEKFNIRPLFFTNEDYPKRLLNCYDSPVMLYYKGSAALNSSRIISIVGTRNNSEYGKMFCEKLVEELKEEKLLIVSGLAFGIDTIAHKAALKNNIETIGVVAHGLDRIYPPHNKLLAKQMLNSGGLLSDFMSNTLPDKQNFPKRNRIVAGICDAVIVIETGKKGGSLITADIADSYNKDVFAVPGRTSDTRSEGCLHLVKTNKASLITCAEDLLINMGWKETKRPAKPKQKELFIELTGDEQTVVGVLQENDSLHIDELYFKSKMSSSALASALLTLEMQGVILSMPGKQYSLA